MSHETKIGIVIMEYDKQHRYSQRPFRVVVNKMCRSLRKYLKKHEHATPEDLALVASYTLLDGKTGHKH